MEKKRVKYHEIKFLLSRLDVLNDQANKSYRLQQFGSIVTFIVVVAGVILAYFGNLELVLLQTISTICISLVTSLFYRQSNKASDDANKFALISIKFNEVWNIAEEAMNHCGFITDIKIRDESVQRVIDKQLEMISSDEIWKLQLDLQKAQSLSENQIENDR